MRTHTAVPRRAARLSRLPLGIASLLAFVLTCQDVTVTPVAVRNVAIDPDDVTLAVGDERKLTAIVTDESGNRLTDRAVTWSTEHENIVSVDAETGDVVALSSGEASVTAAVDGRSGTATIRVMDAPDEEVASVEVDPDTTSIGVGQTVTLEVIARSEGGAVLSGREASWSSEDEDVATVDDEGVVTGESPGDVTIMATIDDVTGTASVTVTEVVESVVTVEVEPTDTSIVVGDTVALKAVARSEDGTELGGREVSWSSNDEDVATVDAEGVVTGVAEGDATITATIEGVSDGAEVTVSLSTVDSVAIQPPELSMLVDDTVRLVAVALTANGDTLTDRAVSWESTNPDIATVDDQGLVTGIAEGDVQITATVDDVSGTAEVTVSLVPVETVEVVPTEASVLVGDTMRLTAIALAENGDTLTGRVATWASADDDIATVDGDGLVTGVAEGEVEITATIDEVPGTASVTVSLVPVDSVAVQPADTTMLVGETVQLNAIALAANGDPIEGRPISWQSSNADIATVDAAGLVEGNAAGEVTITATIDSVPGTANITVSLVAVDSVAVHPADTTIFVGETGQLNATALAANGDPIEGRAISWQSSDEAIATVDATGLVQGNAAGEVTITATIDTVPGTASVTVSLVPVDSVAVQPADTTIFIGETVQLNAIPLAANGDILEDRAVSWASSDTAVATVDENGLVTGGVVLLPASATITATIEGVVGNATVTVALIPVESVDVQPAEPSIVVGEMVQLVATALDANGGVIEGRPVSWLSGSVAVATVDAAGLVTGQSPGEAAITATIEGKADEAQVTVNPVPVEAIIVSPDNASINLLDLDGATFTADVVGHGLPLPGRLITWSVTSAPGLEPCPGVSSSTNAGITLTPLNGTTDVNGQSETTATLNALPLPAAGTAVVYATAEGKVGCARIEVSIL